MRNVSKECGEERVMSEVGRKRVIAFTDVACPDPSTLHLMEMRLETCCARLPAGSVTWWVLPLR